MTSAKEALHSGAVLTVVTLHLLYSPGDPSVIFWQYNSTFIKRLDEEGLPRAPNLEFCKCMAIMQLIWMGSTAARGHLTEEKWYDILTPCCAHEYVYCMPNVSGEQFKKGCDRTMKNPSGIERARMLIDYACSLDLARKIAEVLRLIAHHRVAQGGQDESSSCAPIASQFSLVGSNSALQPQDSHVACLPSRLFCQAAGAEAGHHRAGSPLLTLSCCRPIRSGNRPIPLIQSSSKESILDNTCDGFRRSS
ncbi:hypothetical protein BCV69DRAFT_159261 [Microstroma glucosiphilum]|uniref:Uncharacterized protein n=1 Tax=Pseudomicrostroma glucosiphilum TaxID=1684307 RepID=A0A316U9J0_9BASI|nr:hypothetical protein BCV69DRAFT_159261 [Pseudomicrostroma glucosiphilum]PWN21900.1 hypothetical protein BCV69DRAFT_159261 [Pseudomicrostroma glucosiphilum]